MDYEPNFEWRPIDPLHRVEAFAKPANPLGPLADLPGTWKGHGFNTIWRPHQVGLTGDRQTRTEYLN
jgi:hypothetical protein